MTPGLARRLPRASTAALLGSVALLVCLVAAALVLVLRGNGGGSPAGTPAPSARAMLSSPTVLFGDTVEARLDLILPRRLAGVAFQGHPDFSPFRVLSRHVERADVGGGLERISLRYGIACVSARCVGSSPFLHVQFRPTSISLPGGGVQAAWPPLVEVSRSQGVVAPVTDGLDSGPAVAAGLHPRRDMYEALAAAAASLVALLAAGLVVRRRVERRRAAAARQGTLLQALLARVEAGLPEDVLYRQRHALDALAVELRHRRINGSLVVYAERLAWAPEQPDPREIRALCAEVRRLVKT